MSLPSSRSGRQLVAALTATGGQDGSTGAGAHPQAEAVGLGPATVVGLKGALAHGYLSTVDNCWCGARSFQSAGRRPAAPANYRSDSIGLSVGLSVGLSIGVAVCQRPNPIRFTRESAPRITDSTKRPDRADAVQGTDRQAGRSNSRTPGQCRRLFGTARHADGGACRNRGLVGSAGKLLASGSHGSEPPSPPERLFRGAAVSRRRRPLPFPLVHTCG
jgi:hypothetical protein